MAKVTITLEDTEDGTVGITFDADPPMDTDSDTICTAAQQMAFMMMDSIQSSEDVHAHH